MSIFLQYEGISGESSDKDHSDWVDIDSWSWDVNRKITSRPSTRGDRESSNAEISDLILTKKMDASSNQFFLESCYGRGKTATLHITKTGSGGGADVYMEYTFSNCLITHYAISGNGQDIGRPTEEIHISFVEVSAKYTQYDEDNILHSPNAVGFNTATNQKK